MISSERYPNVFKPLTIRGLTLKNRLQYSPTVVLKCSPEGDVTQEMLDFVKWQAKTGVGYLTIGNTPVVHSDSSAWMCELNVTEDRCIYGIEQMVRTARQNGAEMSIELAHAGRGSAHSSGNPALAPSDVPLGGGELGHIKAMSREDMDYIRDCYVDCAIRCKNAGLKIIMIHCAHNNLLAQFISPASNHRRDEYGGPLENRVKYPLEVLKAVREAVPDMIIELRVSAQEDTPDGLQLPESLDFMELAQPFVDIMHISRGNIFFNYGSTFTIPTYFKGRRLNVAFAAEAKKRLKIPVAVVGNITSLQEADDIIGSGKADIVVMAKAYMADADIVHKSIRGKEADVRPCTRCDWCGNANNFGTSMLCAVNPTLGMDVDLKKLADSPKSVMIIGGGPAGMMAAQTLTEMGHSVKLYEKSDRLGGLLNDATAAPFKEYMRLYLEWDVKKTLECGAEIIYNTEVTSGLVRREKPDAVIVATGSNYITPKVPGVDNPKVVTVSDVENHRVETGESIVVCGGGIVGLECAVMLAMEGKQVTVIDMINIDGFAPNMPVFNKIELFHQLEKHNVRLIGERRVTSFTDSGVIAVDPSGREYVFKGDSYVLAMGVTPNNELAKELLSQYAEGVYIVGDCVSSGRLMANANQDAFHAAVSIK